ncbi:MAG: hypothetical protein JWO13_2463 [Acidobacteriales bacterium]|nr:hypothetical protein [Terriglobales bacterium]
MPQLQPDTHLKVVAHRNDGSLIKGYTDGVPAFYSESLQKQQPAPPPDKLELSLADSGKKVSVALTDLKAMFFVKSFEGSRQYNEVKFFKAHPLVEGLWVRLKFSDNESTEGVIYNSMHYLVNPGFFMKPPDPLSNNQIVYVLRSSLQDFRVLGVRGTY